MTYKCKAKGLWTEECRVQRSTNIGEIGKEEGRGEEGESIL